MSSSDTPPTTAISIAFAVATLMRARGLRDAMWGDGVLVDAYYAAGRPAVHPIQAMASALASMGRSPLFDPYTVNGCDSRARKRVVRMFRLREGSSSPTGSRP